MRLKKISIFTILLVFLLPNLAHAEDVFLDNNALTNFSDANSNIVISELNTGKIISKRDDTAKVAVNKLPNYLALYLLTDDLKNNKTTLTSTINIENSDEVLNRYNLSSAVSVQDALFLLENEESTALLESIFAKYEITLDKANSILSSMSLNDTTLKSLNISDENISTAKNISFLTSIILKNYPSLTEITKNPEFELSSGANVQNSVTFTSSDVFRVLGLDYSGKNSVTYAYSGNTKLIVTVLNQNDDKATYFDKLQKTYEYLFSNYEYKLALKSGEYKINNENITFDNDIYDLFYNKHSIKDVTYLLMNNKILLFQNYETISANDGTVFADFSSNSSSGTFAKVRANFINDSDFSKKDNLEKTNIVINRTKYFATGILAIYSLVFMAFYIMRQVVRKD